MASTSSRTPSDPCTHDPDSDRAYTDPSDVAANLDSRLPSLLFLFLFFVAAPRRLEEEDEEASAVLSSSSLSSRSERTSTFIVAPSRSARTSR